MYGRLTGDAPIREVGSPRRNGVSRGWLLIIALLCAIGFVVVRYAPTFFRAPDQNNVPSPAAAEQATKQSPDLLRHLDNAAASQAEAAAALARSQYWIDRALLSPVDDGLLFRRLQLARSAETQAQEQITRTREELEQTKNNLQGEKGHE